MDINQELKQRILSVLGAPKYRPLAKADLAKVLGRKSGVRMGLNQALRELERAGEIARIRKNRYVLPETADLVTGKLQVHQAGFGFLVSEETGEPDIFIAAENTGTAMNGDRVVARITRDPIMRGRRERRATRRRTRDSHSRTRTRHDRRHAPAIAEFFLRRAGRSAARP